MRARGLKLNETDKRNVENMSRPVRARGLKPPGEAYADLQNASRPVRARGLKQGEIRSQTGEKGRAPCGRVD